MRTRISEHDRLSRERDDFWDHMKSSTRGQRVELECFQYPVNIPFDLILKNKEQSSFSKAKLSIL